MMRLLRLVVAALFAAVLVAACSSDNDTSSSPSGTTSGGAGGGQAGATITIESFKFGDPITVAPGATVNVVNKDAVAHNVVADDGTSFKTADLGQGESATFTAPSKAGEYKFSCTLHSNMTGIGTLTVQG